MRTKIKVILVFFFFVFSFLNIVDVNVVNGATWTGRYTCYRSTPGGGCTSDDPYTGGTLSGSTQTACEDPGYAACATYGDSICAHVSCTSSGGGPATCANGIECGSKYCCDGAACCYCGCKTVSCRQGCCSTVAPSKLAVTQNSPTSSTLTWTAVTPNDSDRCGGGTNNMAGPCHQKVKIGDNSSSVAKGCGDGTCVVNTTVGVTVRKYVTGDVLSPNTLYHYRVISYNSASCNKSSPIKSAYSSCNMNLSAITLKVGGSVQLQSALVTNNINTTATYTDSDGHLSFNPVTTTVYPYTTTVTATSAGSGTVTTTVKWGTSATCTASIPYVVTDDDADSWWQVKDSDVMSNGSLQSSVPGTSLYFNLKGDGGFPGIVTFASSKGGSTNLSTSNVSEKGWLADTAHLNVKTYGSNYFIKNIPSETTINTIELTSVDGSYFESGGVESDGYYWYVYDAKDTGLDLNIASAVNLGSRKVILIVKKAGLNINGNINLTKGSGFFLAVAPEDINIDPAVGGGSTPNLEGIFVTDQIFRSGTTASDADSQLWVRGTVASYGGILLERDLGGSVNASTPAELFEYAPDLELLFPKSLSKNAHIWREVAP